MYRSQKLLVFYSPPYYLYFIPTTQYYRGFMAPDQKCPLSILNWSQKVDHFRVYHFYGNSHACRGRAPRFSYLYKLLCQYYYFIIYFTSSQYRKTQSKHYCSWANTPLGLKFQKNLWRSWKKDQLRSHCGKPKWQNGILSKMKDNRLKAKQIFLFQIFTLIIYYLLFRTLNIVLTKGRKLISSSGVEGKKYI